MLPDIAESSAKAAVDCEAKKGKKDKTKELKVNVSLLANDDGIGSLPHTPTNSNGPLQVSSRSTQVKQYLSYSYNIVTFWTEIPHLYPQTHFINPIQR